MHAVKNITDLAKEVLEIEAHSILKLKNASAKTLLKQSKFYTLARDA